MIPRDADPADGSPVIANSAPIAIVTQSVSRDVYVRSGTWAYITEILQRAGLFFEELPASRLESQLPHSNSVVLLAGNFQLTAAQREVLTHWVKNGRNLSVRVRVRVRWPNPPESVYFVLVHVLVHPNLFVLWQFNCRI